MTHRIVAALRATLPAICLLLLLGSNPLEATEVQLDEPFPLEGEPVGVVVTEEGAPLSGVEVVVHYNPNSATTRQETLPPTDATGRTSWTPLTPSVVRLDATRPSAGDDEGVLASLTASVRFERFPFRGMIIMALAALLLFGGALSGLFALMKPSSQHLPEPPST